MEFVQPIRDLKKINAMKKVLLAGKHGPRNHLMFVLGINSGLRISDLLKLKFEHILTPKQKIRDFLAIREKKTGKYKMFPLNKSTAGAIKIYLQTLKNVEMDDYLFKSAKGNNKPISRTHAWKILNSAAKDVGIKERIGSHSLRKTFGYHAYKAGVDISRLQYIFNHSAPSLTLRYIGITQDDIDDVYISLNL